MATAAKKVLDDNTVEIIEVKTGIIDCYVLGTSPIILNRMPEKAWRELLAPKGRKTMAGNAPSARQ